MIILDNNNLIDSTTLFNDVDKYQMQHDVCLVTGGFGLVGKAIQDVLSQIFNIGKEINEDVSKDLSLRDSSNVKIIDPLLLEAHPSLKRTSFVFVSSSDADLRDYDSTRKLFERVRPVSIIHLAAKVGGLFSNLENNIEFFWDNMKINENIVKLCAEYKIQKGIFCLSTCVFPAVSSIPMTEIMLCDGPPHYSNEGYAMSKRILEMLVRFYRQKYNFDWICIIPTNLYGKYDNFNLENSHVIPGLIHRCLLCKNENKVFTVLGSGNPLRQFVYSFDLAKIILFMLSNNSLKHCSTSIIIADELENEYSISYVAKTIADQIGLNSALQFDESREDGIFRKTASNALLRSIIGKDFTFTSIENGLKETVEWFKKNYEYCRR